MNILYYCCEYPPARTGGIGNVTKIIAEELVRRGHNIYVVGYYHDNETLPEYSEINGVKIYRLNAGYREGKLKSTFSKVLNRLKLNYLYLQKEVNYAESFLEKLIKSENIQILEFPDYYQFNHSTRSLTFKKFNIPTILKIHGCMSFIEASMGKKSQIEYKNDSLHFSRCDYISAVSRYSLQYVVNNFETNQILSKNVIYNPLEDKFLHKSNFSSNKTILFIGKVSETKGCFSLLKAFNKVALIHRDWRLVIVGPGDINAAKQLIHPSFNNNVAFLGFCNREKVKETIDNCSFACVPTYFENFSMVALEIMARQKSLIFTNRTSGSEIIKDGIDGLLVDPENIEDIAQAIIKLIENPTLRNEMAEKAYLKIKNNFISSVICNQIEQFYTQVINLFNIKFYDYRNTVEIE